MNSEITRIRTFSNWRYHLQVWPLQLARAGFYQKEDEDVVECYACNLRIANTDWRRGQNPTHIHRQRSPHCPHFTGDNGNNVSLLDLGSDGPQFHNDQQIPVAAPVNNQQPPNIYNPHAFPGMQDALDRLDTYAGHCHIIPKRSLAMAGLFRKEGTGYSDCVTCFHCGAVVKNWKRAEDPLQRHMHESPDCQFAAEIYKRHQKASTTSVATENRMTAILSGRDMQLNRNLVQYTEGDRSTILQITCTRSEEQRSYRLIQVELIA